MKKVAKSAKSGKFVSRAFEQKHKSTTVIQSVGKADDGLSELKIKVENAARLLNVAMSYLSDLRALLAAATKAGKS